MKITNNTREALDFIVNGNAKDGVPPTKSIAAGETEDIDVVENAQFRGRVAAGAVTVARSTAKKAAAADGATRPSE